jgi:hypothetical protein
MDAAHPTRQRAVCAAQSYHKHVCAAQQWLRTAPHHTLMHQACSLHPAMFTVALHAIAASTAACERQQAMRNLFAMDSVTARAMLTRVEDKLVSVFLSQQQQQHSQHASSTAQDMLHTDLYEADKVLPRLQGQTVSESNANKEELCRLSSMYRSSGCSEVTCPSIQYMSTRTLVCIASILIARNVGSDLERTKAMNRSFHLSKTCEFVISIEIDIQPFWQSTHAKKCRTSFIV